MRARLSQDEFCKQFVAVFCGAWCANHYDDACINSEHEELENPPIDDAIYLADTAWTAYIENISL